MNNQKPGKTTRKISSIEKNLLGVPVNGSKKLIPGVIAVTLLAWVSIWLSDFIGVNLMGFDRSPVSPVLLAILLGIRLTIFDVFRLGIFGIPIVLVCITAALFITTRINKWLHLPERLGALIAVGTSICGVSAIVATGPAIEAEEE